MADLDQTIAILTTTLLIFLGIQTCILQVLNFSHTSNNSAMEPYIIQPNIAVSLVVLIVVLIFIVPGVTALVANMKKSPTTRLVHLVILSLASAGLLAVLCQDMWTLNQVGNSYACTVGTVQVQSTQLCTARDTRISNFVLMLLGLIILVANLIYTGLVFCKSQVSERGD
ncbi:uncharacterized protein LOC124279797 isoform X2 [Haliotis rubra]|uniref:uncharacterized protein LOC124279797 isoform X2 n=1 Tax=Haliotis rubra TaxID=36100 RepID=UPI001EE546F1|nr:uncharacterized protein LOC124279797 isoform X2 [Haliotis rubra]